MEFPESIKHIHLTGLPSGAIDITNIHVVDGNNNIVPRCSKMEIMGFVLHPDTDGYIVTDVNLTFASIGKGGVVEETRGYEDVRIYFGALQNPSVGVSWDTAGSPRQPCKQG